MEVTIVVDNSYYGVVGNGWRYGKWNQEVDARLWATNNGFVVKKDTTNNPFTQFNALQF